MTNAGPFASLQSMESGIVSGKLVVPGVILFVLRYISGMRMKC